MQAGLTYLRRPRRRDERQPRRGVVVVTTALFLVILMGFIAFSLDTGLVTVTQGQMQNAVDAAALAASQEITIAIEEAGQSGGDGTSDINSIAVGAAKDMAVGVAAANGVYLDADTDIQFGKRIFDESTNTWPIQWNAEPYNVVRVQARRTEANTSLPDGQVKLAFGWALGKPSVALQAGATAFVEARDIVVVLDYSGSMNDDSTFAAMSSSRLGKPAVEANMDQIWNTLVGANKSFSNSSKLKFPSGGWGNLKSAAGTYYSYNDDNDVLSALGLDQVDSSGKPKYPFPQEGKNSGGSLKGMPSSSTSQSLWKGYINWVRTDSTVNNYGYRKKYGYRTLVGYLLNNRYQNSQSEDLWRTPHYPFHAMKNGTTLFMNFLESLDFGDHVGLVTYDTQSRVETGVSGGGFDSNVSLGDALISDNYTTVDTIQRSRQAGHYGNYTGMGYGIYSARTLLGSHGRFGARPTMLVMTDGQTNQAPSNWSLPPDWDWDEITDMDGDGDAEYETNDSKKQYAFWQAMEAVNAGVTIHTLSVGIDADRPLMQAIAFVGGGIWIDVPGGSTIQDMEEQILEAFSQIAAAVPPAKLVFEVGTPYTEE